MKLFIGIAEDLNNSGLQFPNQLLQFSLGDFQIISEINETSIRLHKFLLSLMYFYCSSLPILQAFDTKFEILFRKFIILWFNG